MSIIKNNTGNCNSGNFNSGCFNTIEQPPYFFNKILEGKTISAIIAGIALALIPVFMPSSQPAQIAGATEYKITELKKTETAMPIIETKSNWVENNLIKKEEEPESKPVEIDIIKNDETSPIQNLTFTLNNGKKVSGKELIDEVKANPNGNKLYQAFLEKHGVVVADISAITLKYENGTYWEKTTGVCSKKYQIGGDYRNCNYADLNSAGLDAGLKQINTYYQKARIEKLSGIKCDMGKSQSKDRANECNQKLVEWLHNVDNNITIALDLYEESGFGPWYGCKRAFKNHGVNNYCRKYA